VRSLSSTGWNCKPQSAAGGVPLRNERRRKTALRILPPTHAGTPASRKCHRAHARCIRRKRFCLRMLGGGGGAAWPSRIRPEFPSTVLKTGEGYPSMLRFRRCLSWKSLCRSNSALARGFIQCQSRFSPQSNWARSSPWAGLNDILDDTANANRRNIIRRRDDLNLHLFAFAKRSSGPLISGFFGRR